jgi:hypothetical protein
MMDHFTFVWLSSVYQDVALTMHGWNVWFDTNLCKIDEQFLEYHVRYQLFNSLYYNDDLTRICLYYNYDLTWMQHICNVLQV